MSDSISKTYVFCGAGGSGMSALALICKQMGARVYGTDRAYDNGVSLDKFVKLEQAGLMMKPQDGSAISDEIDALIVSTAVEDSIPDVKAAKDAGVPIIKRAELLAQMFNQSPCGVSIAGTSGKSTVTGMVAHVLTQLEKDPTVMNGAVIKNFASNMRVGDGGVFVTETDESDGSIALYNPAISVLNNVALDHKTMEELDQLFGDFIARASKAVVLNFDDPKLREFASKAGVPIFSYALNEETGADLIASNIEARPDGVNFRLNDRSVKLQLPGHHNVSNALACLSVCRALDIDLVDAISALEKFEGITRRMDVVGTKNNITVIDDFGHNPDKISATLKTLKSFEGRLIVMFQPHGFGPLRLMGKEMAEVFATYLSNDDVLFMPEAYYAGGTVDRSVTAQDVIAMVKERGANAQWFATRDEIATAILDQVRSGDRVIIMGARDDTLTDFAKNILRLIV